ncbi:hypothetical protein E1A91_A08G273600v1 [Gossypium mustelinum]|uniref:Uncharacterized protein n=1 Tax=Gossypium mustelinum TaxID=34275 RepID=A0A5D2YEI5_GOSMU|nr:hypothetical protein E1A91_A08G273600v1 [Gossypium mustelinum]
MEITGEPPPLWPQLATATIHRRRRQPPSPLFSPPFLIILLPTIALLLLFFAVPPFLSTIAAQISQPTGVKKNSDSLNLFLVFFAIFCGFFARRNDGSGDGDNENSRNDGDTHINKQQWFDQYPVRKIYDDHPPPINAVEETTVIRRLKRNSSSYPDLRQESLWENSEDRSRFYDDYGIKYYNDEVHELRRSWRSDHRFEECEPKVIISPAKSPARSTPPPPPPPPPPAAAYRKPRRSYQAVGRNENVNNTRKFHVKYDGSESPAPQPVKPPPPPAAGYRKPRRSYQAVGRKENVNNAQKFHVEYDGSESPAPQPVTPPPPPPPPPRRPPSPVSQLGYSSEQRYGKLERRKSNATKEIKMVFASLRKRKKKKAKDDYRYESPANYSTSIPPPSPPPPPPPMPPPPSSVFKKYNLFKSKGSKSKRIHSVPPPPPPLPPPSSVSKPKQNTQSPPPPPPPPPAPPTPPLRPSRRRTTTNANNYKPPLPTTKPSTSFYHVDENVNSGEQSPLIPKPPPPPPEFNDDEKVSMMDGDDGAIVGRVPVFCPSPDVNAKAETFIARLRDGWKLEKINSMKEKQEDKKL